jgi:xanthine dehydrogenase accessory factor
LLGPAKRKAEVLATAGLNEAQLRYAIAGPMGLALGGDLPESIALSVLAECHAKVFGSNALPLSEMAQDEMQMHSIVSREADAPIILSNMRASL